MKICKKCHKEKPVWDFDYDKKSPDYMSDVCITCSNRTRFPIVSTKKRKKR